MNLPITRAQPAQSHNTSYRMAATQVKGSMTDAACRRALRSLAQHADTHGLQLLCLSPFTLCVRFQQL
jgi:hypothetical protein